MTKEQLKIALNNKGIWTYEEEGKLKESENTIEEIQISIYKNFLIQKQKRL